VERMLRDPSYFSEAWWNHTYVGRGRYAEQLERWFAMFPREQLLVLFSDDLLQQPAETYALVLDFLGVDAHELSSYPRIFSREYRDMSPATRSRLEGVFAGPSAELAELLGREPPWRSAAS
jgi:Sulfotransferase domain